MKFALFAGCKIPYYVPQYGTSTIAVMNAFGVELVEMEFGCCGYPVRHRDSDAHLLQALTALALAEKEGLDIITPCKCCFGSLRLAEYTWRTNPSTRERINKLMSQTGTPYQGKVRAWHPLQILLNNIGPKAIEEKVKHSLKGLKAAVHSGCHALRPSHVTRFDNPVDPYLFDEVVRATGVSRIHWEHKLDCCGGPQWGKNDELSGRFAKDKIVSARQGGADIICTACTYCQMQFDNFAGDYLAGQDGVPSVLFSQLLGVAMGLDEKVLGIKKNSSDPARLWEVLAG